MLRAFKNYFSITKKEWNGMVVLLILICLVLAAPYVLQFFHKDTVMDLKDFKKAVAQLKSAKAIPGDNGTEDLADNPDADVKNVDPVMVKFNPNNLPVEQWQKLGLSLRQISGIKKYEAKGGKFYTKADVQKMYTVTPDDYTRLEPYIDLPSGEAKAKKGDVVIELNTADSAKLTELRGVGPSFAVRILNYRKQLGGFYQKGQLKEIYGMDSIKYAGLITQVTIDRKKILKININKVTVDDLRHFPYFNFKQMNAIVEYRKQHGDYHSINDLQEIALLDEEILRKIAPYLAYK